MIRSVALVFMLLTGQTLVAACPCGPGCQCPDCDGCCCPVATAKGVQVALASRAPLVLWVNQPVAYSMPGAISSRIDNGRGDPQVWVYIPAGPSLAHAGTLRGIPQRSQVQALLRKPSEPPVVIVAPRERPRSIGVGFGLWLGIGERHHRHRR